MRSNTKRVLQELQGIAEVADSDGGLVVHAKNGSEILVDVVSALDKNNLRPNSLNMSSPTLDDVFLHYTGRRIRPEELVRKTNEPFLM